MTPQFLYYELQCIVAPNGGIQKRQSMVYKVGSLDNFGLALRIFAIYPNVEVRVTYMHSFIQKLLSVCVHACMYVFIYSTVCLGSVLSLRTGERIDPERKIFVIQREKLIFRLSKTQERECFEVKGVIDLVDWY